MKRNVFTFRDKQDETLTAKQFGYWSISWAHENAIEELNSLLQKTEYRIVDSISRMQFPAYLQFLSLYVATYWTYAFLILHVPISLLKEMQIGMEDGLNTLGDSEGAGTDGRDAVQTGRGCGYGRDRGPRDHSDLSKDRRRDALPCGGQGPCQPDEEGVSGSGCGPSSC